MNFRQSVGFGIRVTVPGIQPPASPAFAGRFATREDSFVATVRWIVCSGFASGWCISGTSLAPFFPTNPANSSSGESTVRRQVHEACIRRGHPWPGPARRRAREPCGPGRQQGRSASPTSTARPARSRPTASRRRPACMMGLDYATRRHDDRGRQEARRDREGRPGQARRGQVAAGRGLRRRQGRHRGRPDAPRAWRWRCCRWPRNTRRSCWSSPRSPTRSPATSGTSTSSAPAATARRTRSPTPWRSTSQGVAIATLAQDYAFGRDGVKALQGRDQEGQDRPRGVPADQHHRLHRRRAAPHRRS